MTLVTVIIKVLVMTLVTAVIILEGVTIVKSVAVWTLVTLGTVVTILTAVRAVSLVTGKTHFCCCFGPCFIYSSMPICPCWALSLGFHISVGCCDRMRWMANGQSQWFQCYGFP